MTVSHSELACFRRCPREHHYRYHLRVESTATGEALQAGKRVHAALGAFHRGETTEPWVGIEKPLERALMRGYVARWAGSGVVVERTDIPFVVSIGGVEVVGELDGIGVDVDGARVIIEHKTTSEDIAPGSAYWRRVVNSDAQVSTYLYASRALGLGAERILYDVLRKSALRGKKGESDDDLELRALADMAERPEHYYARASIVRLDEEHAAHERDVAGTVHLMQSAREFAPRNSDSCQKFGRECDFFSVCFQGGSIDDESRFKRRLARKGDFTGGGTPAANTGLRPAWDGQNDASGERAAGVDSGLGPRSGPDERGTHRGSGVVVGEPEPDTQYRF